MNALQPLATSTDISVSLNPQREPEAGLVEREFVYEHPIFTAEAGAYAKTALVASRPAAYLVLRGAFRFRFP